MFILSGDLAAAFNPRDLPPDAELAIVSSSPETVSRILRSVSYASVRKVHPGAAPKTARVVINKKAFEPDARSRAIVEGVRIAQDDLEVAGGAYDLNQVRGLLRGISRQAVAKKVQEGSLLAVPGPSNRQSFPTFQFNGDGTLVRGLRVVREALPTRNPWTVLNFLTNPDERLEGRKPIDLLKTGEVDIVVEAALRVGEQGA